jgi:hypothetical protein
MLASAAHAAQQERVRHTDSGQVTASVAMSLNLLDR